MQEAEGAFDAEFGAKFGRLEGKEFPTGRSALRSCSLCAKSAVGRDSSLLDCVYLVWIREQDIIHCSAIGQHGLSEV